LIVKHSAADTLKTRPTLLSKVRRGDEDGWRQFYDLYEDFIYSAARAAGLSHEEARDVLQETMITVRNYVSGFVPDETRARFRTWLKRIVYSRISDEYRRKRRNPLEHTRDAHNTLAEESSTSKTNQIPNLTEVELDRLVDGKLEQAMIEEARRLAKERISMEQYQAYDLFAVQQLSAYDVAASLGINVVTVRVRAFRVRRAVNRELRRIVRMIENPTAPARGKSIG
jgi:RNA polymerase sigma factor (sigma-70 family)